MIRYRIKTKEEFITEFGIDWRRANNNTRRVSFVHNMDCLLGKEIDINFFDGWIYNPGCELKPFFRSGEFKKEYHKNYDLIIKCDSFCGFYFSMDMLKQISPSYNEIKVLVYD